MRLAQWVVVAGLSLAAARGGEAQKITPDVAKRVDGVFAKWNRADSPGCALGVYRGGQIVYKRGYGIEDLNEDVHITPGTVFHVASMSKQFTAAAVVLLAQQGKLSLDDDVRKYIPELPDFGQKITIRNLVHHTSGLRDQWALLELAGWRYSQDLITNEDVMSLLTRQKELNFKPGERHLYSNTGYTLLGLIVKRVSGMSLREFTTKNIFEPLGMTRTHFRDDHAEVIKHNAVGYAQETGKPFEISITNFDTVGATSLHTTVEDLQRWDENFYQPKVGGAAFVQQMLQRGKLNNGEQLDYAFGLVIDKDKGLPTIGHGGADAGYRSDMIRYPEQHFSVAVLCNSAEADPSGLAGQVADIVLAKEFKAAEAATPSKEPAARSTTGTTVALTSEQMSAFTGLYWNRADDAYDRIYVKEGQLIIDGDEPLVLKPFAESRFHIADKPWGDEVEIHFVANGQDKPRRMEQSFGGGKPLVYDATEASSPTAAELHDYPGAYVSEEIDPVYRIVLDGDKLSLVRLKHEAENLRPAVRDVFTGQIGTVRFVRDANGHVAGFVLNAGRILNFHFTKRAN
ncbi:MAG TPA: serine hydrolase domain-containing protein [Candidatus Sulfotelmatobacter sp.]|nr:serine hydrolase domain-containing protein [Candidatus Sulfotelmatobacter sp.]